MRIYRLYYVFENNGETGDVRSYPIMQTTDKNKIENFIEEHNLTVQTDLGRGESKVFVYDSFEPDFPEYTRMDMLKYALEDLAKHKKAEEDSKNIWSWLR